VRVIEQARLAFREGSSDKVYEVDLVEVAAGQYVVNFRYGRRGAALRDGTKTPTPLPMAKAKAAYDKYQKAKKYKGHYDTAKGTTFAIVFYRLYGHLTNYLFRRTVTDMEKDPEN
jgi:hypothetical protein